MTNQTSGTGNVSGQPIQMSSVMQNPAVPKLYVNGFSLGTSLSDVFVIAQIAGSSNAVLLMSFTTAKTLAQQMSSLVAEFERVTGQDLLTMEDIQKAVSKAGGEVKM